MCLMVESERIAPHRDYCISPSARSKRSYSYTNASVYSELFHHHNVLQRFDKLCESFGNTLLEVGLSIFQQRLDLEEHLVDTMRIFRNCMPAMKARGCLSFRIVRGPPREFCHPLVNCMYVFEQADEYWTKLKLDD